MAVTTRVETITPKRAQEYLDRFKSNRRERKVHVDRIANAIRNDRFKLTHQGVAVNADGETMDGWHRLRAVVQAGKPVKMLVTKGLPQEALTAIDLGRNRDISDIAHTLGSHVTPQMAATARSMLIAFGNVSAAECVPDTEGLLEFIRTHFEAISFACGKDVLGPRKSAAFRAVVARAFYTVDFKRLTEFLNVCETGIPDGRKDFAAVAIRDFYFKNRTTLNSWERRAEMYAKTESALAAFLKGADFPRLYGAREELFPLPGETS